MKLLKFLIRSWLKNRIFLEAAPLPMNDLLLRKIIFGSQLHFIFRYLSVKNLLFLIVTSEGV